MASRTSYFSHITGLRGLAILLVVLFHLNSSVFPCCFYGVDVFLLISGYLLFVSLQKQKKGIREAISFSNKKIQRIIPPVSAVILLTVICSIFVLDFSVLSEACKLGCYTLIGISNIYLRNVSVDYFASNSTESPFLHMWYIGVTLQVYLIFIVGKIICDYLPKILTKTIIILAGVISFIICYRMQLHDFFKYIGLPVWEHSSAPTYFETLPRLWEVLAGGCIFYLPTVKKRYQSTLLGILGLLCIIIPSFICSEQTSTMFPVILIGTILVIKYIPETKIAPILNNKLLLSIGTISFSLYLVHMPIFECYKSWIITPPTAFDYVLMLLLTAIFGTACWYFIERHKLSWKTWGILYMLCMSICYLGRKTKGFETIVANIANVELLVPYHKWQVADNKYFENNFNSDILSQNDGVFHLMQSSANAHNTPATVLQLGHGNCPPDFILIGDSHAQATYSGLDTFCKENNRSGLYLTTILSPFWNRTIPEISGRPNYSCNREKMKSFLDWLSATPDIKHVVVATYWNLRQKEDTRDWDMKPVDTSAESQTESLRIFLRKMKSMNKQTYFILPYPRYANHPLRHMRLILRRGLNIENHLTPITCTQEEYKQKNAHTLLMLQTLEKEGLCILIDPCAGRPNGPDFCAFENNRLLFVDHDHLSVNGSISYAKTMSPQLLKYIPEAKPTDLHTENR